MSEEGTATTVTEPAFAGSARGGFARVLHHLAVLAVPALACWLAVFDLRHTGARSLPASDLRLAAGLFTLGLAAAALGACLALWAAGRWRTTAFAPLRFAFVLFALATGVQLGFFQPYDYGSWARVFVPAAMAATLSLPFVVWRSERPGSRVVRALDFLVFNLCLLPFLAEAALRVAPRFSNSPLFDFDTLSARDRIDRNRWEPGEPRFGFPLNRDSNYDTERALSPLEGPLVVTVGDSFSQGVVPHRYHYTTVAEQALATALPGVEIYNVGVGAIGPPEYRILVREQALPLDPDLIVVSLFLGNDSEIEVVYRGRAAALAPWFNRRNLRATMVVKRLRALRREREQADRHVPDMEFSKRTYGATEELLAAFPWLGDPLLEEPTFSERSFLRIEKERVVQCCWSGKSDFGALFASLAGLLEDAGDVPLAFLLIPDEFQVEDPLWKRLEQVPPGIPKERLERDLIQTAVRAWLDERAVPYLDLLPTLRAVEPLADGWRHLYKLRDTHLNVRGNAEVARAFARFLEERLDAAGAVR